MAQFGVHGLDDLMLSMEEIAQIPDDVQDEMLDAMADVVVTAQKNTLRTMGVEDTGAAIASIKKGTPKTKNGQRVINVTPSGTRRRGKKKGKTVTRNAEIVFVNEFGRRRQPGRPAIKTANETSAEATTQAGFAVYDKWLKSKNL